MVLAIPFPKTSALLIYGVPQPYLQKEASSSGTGVLAHWPVLTWALATTIVRPRNRAAATSLIVQPMGT